MGDTLNSLLTAQHSSSVLDSIAHPSLVNPLAAINSGNQAASGVFDLRDKQGQMLWGQALQQSTDPTTGVVDYNKANRIAATMGPAAAQAAARNLQNNSALTGAQISQATALHGLVGNMAISLMNDPSDENVAKIRAAAVASNLPPSALGEIDRIAALPSAQRGAEAYKHAAANLDALGQLARGGYPAPSLQNVGGQIVAPTVTPPSPYGPGGVKVVPGAVETTLSPAESLQGGIEYPATQEDVQAGRATAIGQPVRVSGPDMITRFGLGRMLPPGARAVGPAAAGGGGGGGVRDANGNPVSPNNPPRLNVTPPTPASPQGVPAPPGGMGEAVPGANYTSGVGAALGASRAAPAAALPTPPTPPAVVPPPAAVAAPPPAPIPPNAPRASLQGGVPVASTNALQPNVGAPGLPSPLVPGDVSAIMGGMNRARGAPAGGTQTAFNTVAVGPGTEEAQGYKTSADKLAADRLEATNFQATQFPYVQALKNYGDGTKTGPGTDFWNQVAGSIRTPLAKIGINVGPLADTTERVDALGKWLASIQSGNPVSAKSDAELAQVLKGSASTHINEVAGEDMVKAGLALQRMKNAAVSEWQNNPAVQQQYGTYLNFLGHYNQTIDPRAFAVDTYNPVQIARLRTQIQSGSEGDAQRFENSLALAKRNGMIGGAGSQAMP